MRALLNSEGAHVFENAYCAAPDCGPSRTAMLTGVRPKTTGFTDNSARPLEESGVWKDWTTLAKAFSNDRRFTASVGKVNHDGYGFGEFDYDSARIGPSLWCVGNSAIWCEQWWWRAYDNDAATADNALELLDTIDSAQKGFFFALGLHKPHVPWPFEPEDWDKNADIPDGVAADLRRHPTGARDPIAGLPMYTSGREPGTNSWRRWGAPKLIDYALEGPPWSLKSDGATKVLRRAYASSVTRTDVQLGRVMAAARAKGSWFTDNTIVLFTADHGFALGEAGKIGKSALFDVMTRVPLGVVLPAGVRAAQAATRVPRRFVSLLDVYPTLMRLGGVDNGTYPSELEGVDLWAPLGQSGVRLDISTFAETRASATGRLLPTSLGQAVYPVVDNTDGGRQLAVEGLRYNHFERERDAGDPVRDDEAAQVVAELYRFDLELYNTASVGGDDAGGGATGGVDDGRHCTYAESENVALDEPALAAALHKVLQQMVVSPLTARAGMGARNVTHGLERHGDDDI